MDIDKTAVGNFVARHATLLIVVIAFITFGGLRNEAYDTFKQASFAVMLTVILSHIVLFVYSPDSFNGEENLNAKARIFNAVALLVGLVYAGSYFVAFSN